MLCSFMDSLYFYGLLALGGLCAHLYEYPPHEFHTLPHLGSDCETYPPPSPTLIGGLPGSHAVRAPPQATMMF